jgi:ApbE superfamily uncharacterized protein (UPF0280 family)
MLTSQYYETRCHAYRAQKMVSHQRSVTLVANLLSGARNGLAIGPMFAIAVTVVAKQNNPNI